MIRIKCLLATLTLAFLLAAMAGCRTPAQKTAAPENDRKSAAVAVTETPAADTELAPAVAHILRAAGRSGSLVYRADCGPRRAFTEIYPLNPVVAPEPMDQALTEIGWRYPNIRWNETSTGLVRVTDRAARAGLLQVRIPEFILLDDRGPADALNAVWKTPEVRAFIRKTGVRALAGQSLGRGGDSSEECHRRGNSGCHSGELQRSCSAGLELSRMRCPRTDDSGSKREIEDA